MSDVTALYRHFAANGDLLYVGISRDYWRRTMQHEARSAWFRDVCRVDVEHYDTRVEARAAEAQAIRGERPLHNIQSGRRPLLDTLTSEQTKDLCRVWHCAAFKTRAVVSYCQNVLGVDAEKEDLLSAFGRRKKTESMTHDEIMATLETMK